MAEIAQRVLMNEFKQMCKEKWTNIEVRTGDSVWCGVAMTRKEHLANHDAAHQRERLRMERRSDSIERPVHVLRWLFQGEDELSPQLPAPTARYVIRRFAALLLQKKLHVGAWMDSLPKIA
jgi:hypothetical protein